MKKILELNPLRIVVFWFILPMARFLKYMQLITMKKKNGWSLSKNVSMTLISIQLHVKMGLDTILKNIRNYPWILKLYMIIFMIFIDDIYLLYLWLYCNLKCNKFQIYVYEKTKKKLVLKNRVDYWIIKKNPTNINFRTNLQFYVI